MANVRYENAGLLSYISKIGDAEDTVPPILAERFSTTVRGRIKTTAYNTGFMHDSTEPSGDTVTVNAYYGVFVNYGTYKMAARPFWEPSIADFQVIMPEIITPYLRP